MATAGLRQTVALLGLTVCTVGFVSVPVGVAIFGPEEPSDLGAAVGGVIGSAFCLALIAHLLSPPRPETEGAGLLRFMTVARQQHGTTGFASGMGPGPGS